MIDLTLTWSDKLPEVSENGIIILVDTLRASTTITVALHAGAKEVIAVRDEQRARALKRNNPDLILAGERNGIKLDGFDCGNSPYYLSEHSNDKSIVLTTSNFCNVIEKVSKMDLPLLAASLVNAMETAKYIKIADFSNVYLIATGTYQMAGKRYKKPLHSEEDLMAALFIAYELSKLVEVDKNIFEDHLEMLTNPDHFVELLWNTDYSHYLLVLDEKMGNDDNKRDMNICFDVNKYPCMPVLQKKEDLLIFKNYYV